MIVAALPRLMLWGINRKSSIALGEGALQSSAASWLSCDRGSSLNRPQSCHRRERLGELPEYFRPRSVGRDFRSRLRGRRCVVRFPGAWHCCADHQVAGRATAGRPCCRAFQPRRRCGQFPARFQRHRRRCPRLLGRFHRNQDPRISGVACWGATRPATRSTSSWIWVMDWFPSRSSLARRSQPTRATPWSGWAISREAVAPGPRGTGRARSPLIARG